MMKKQCSGASECDIAIAGGGLVGLTLTLMLAREAPHLKVTVLDPFNFDQPEDIKTVDNRTTALSKGTANIFKALGFWSYIKPFATPIYNVDVSDKGHLGRTYYPNHKNAQSITEPLGYVVQNQGFGKILLAQARLAPSVTLLSKKAIGFTPKARGGVVDICDDGSRVSLITQCFVVADGAQSALRDILGVQVSQHSYQQHAIISTLTHSKRHAGTAYERFTAQGPMALLPYGGHINAQQSALVWTRPKALLESSLNLSDSAFLARIQQQFGYRLGVFEKVESRHHYPLHLILAKEQVRSSLVILGNAAHFLHPVAGQGFNLSVRDCAALVTTLTQADHEKRPLGAMSVLASYQAQQALDQKATVQLSDTFIRLFSHASPSVQLLRNAGLLALQKTPPIQSAFFGLMMGQGFTRTALACERDDTTAHNKQALS